MITKVNEVIDEKTGGEEITETKAGHVVIIIDREIYGINH